MNFTNPMTKFRHSKIRPVKNISDNFPGIQIFSPEFCRLDKTAEKFVKLKPSLYTRMKVSFNRSLIKSRNSKERQESYYMENSLKINYRHLRVKSSAFRSNTPVAGEHLVINKIYPNKQKSIQKNLIIKKKDLNGKRYSVVKGGSKKDDGEREERVEVEGESSGSDSDFEYLQSRLNTNS